MNDSIILTNKNNMKDIITFVQRALCTVAVCVLAHVSAMAQNPYLPLWEYIPDGEPYVFDDPDVPGKKRVYVYGSHDSRIKDYCGLELVTWSASLDSLDKWRYDGVIFESKKDAKGNYLHADKRGTCSLRQMSWRLRAMMARKLIISIQTIKRGDVMAWLLARIVLMDHLR